MGTDCAPFLANLYRFVLEYEWVSVQEQTVEGRERLRVLVLVGRYIDDLFAVNGEEVLTECLWELYQGLEVKKESRTRFRSHFLDLDIVVNDGRLILATYDKRDAFPFEVRSYYKCARIEVTWNNRGPADEVCTSVRPLARLQQEAEGPDGEAAGGRVR